MSGGDPSGLLLALVLARHGRTVTVLRRGGPDAPSPTGVSPFLSPSSLDVLGRLGLVDRLIGSGRRVNEILEDVGRGLSRAVSFGGAGRFGYALSVPLSILNRALVDAITAEPAATIHYDVRVAGFDQDAISVRVRLADGRVLSAGLLVCGDGVASATRDHAGIDAEVVEFGRPVVLTRIPSRAWPDRITVRHDGDTVVSAIPLAGGRMIVQWIGDDAELARMRASDPRAELGGRLRQGLPELAHHLADTPARWDDVLVVEHRVVRARRWSRGRVVLVGSAAHGVHSLGGQSLDLGVQDAGVLAWELVRAPDWATVTTLNRYAEIRRPFVERFQDYQLAVPQLTGSSMSERSDTTIYRPIADVLRDGQPEATRCWRQITTSMPTGARTARS